MSSAMTPRRTAATMVAAAVLVNLAFTGLGTAFDYPEVLKHPPAEALAAFRAAQGVVSTWFLLLALGAALLAPVAIGVGGSPTTGPCASPSRSGSRRPPCRSSASCAA